jgi:Domain of unknown function (DUF4214)/Subtilase family
MKCRRFLVVSLLFFVIGSANAQTGKTGLLAKLPDSLVALHAQHTAHLTQGVAVPFSSKDPLVSLIGDRVVIDAIASGDVDTLKADLEFLGMQDAVAFGRVVSGQLPISSIAAAGALATLQFAQPAVAMTNAGTVTSQGDQAMRSNVARTTFGVDGTGVKVGVLSNSFNCLGGAATDVANGDLSPVTVVQEISNCVGASDEGRAMLQIIHDVAPGASLSFASAFNGMASFATNIQALAAAGAKVIVDDVLYFAEPFFQDGIVAQAVDNVVAGGGVYFSAASNQGRQSYESVFRPGDSFNAGAFSSAPGAPPFFGGRAHDFNPGGGKDHFQSITIPGQTTVFFTLQWDSPFFSVSGSPGTQNDVDIYLLNSSRSRILAGSTFGNVGGDAVEIFAFTNSGAKPLNVNLMIVKFSDTDPTPGLIKYIYFGSATINEFNTNSSTIFGHANAAGAEAVGAAAYFNTPEFGVSPPVLDSYSSAGGTPILFNLAGNPTSDPRTNKPGIVAPDCANTTFFVSGVDLEPDAVPNFCGTSAAAPHAAAVAALLLDLKPTLTPTQIYETLEETAINIGAPGFDNDSGFGLIQADAALVGHPDFVRQQYLDFLDREPDSGELSFWVSQLNGGLPRASLIAAVMDSSEFQFKGKFIAQTYLGILTRDADHGGFRGWLGALLAGVSREQIVQAFLDSGEFQSNFGSNLTNGQFVERMYNNILLRPSDPGGFSFWLGQLDSGQMTRAQVTLSLLNSTEFQALFASQNRVDVSLLYFDMLRRDPDAGGFSAWVGALNAGVPLTSVIDGFLNSAEYQSRF